MRKILILAIALVFTVALFGTAAAARKQFSDFSIDIPAGWASSEHVDEKGNKTAVLSNSSKEMKMLIGFEPLEGKTVKQKAEEFAGMVKSSVSDLGDETYHIPFADGDGKETHMILAPTDDGRFLGAAITGNMNDPDVEAILDSIDD